MRQAKRSGGWAYCVSEKRKYEIEQAGHEDRFPFGPEPEGFLIYTPDGFVSAQLMKPGRPPFQKNDWSGGTTDEYEQKRLFRAAKHRCKPNEHTSPESLRVSSPERRRRAVLAKSVGDVAPAERICFFDSIASFS